MAAPIEEMVAEAVCVRLDGVSLAEYIQAPGSQPDGLHEAIRADEQELLDLARDFAEKRFTRAEYFTMRDVIEARLNANRAAIGKRTGRAVLSDVAGGDRLRERWPAESLDWRRAVLAAVIDTIVIQPAVKGRNTFDPRLVDIRWK